VPIDFLDRFSGTSKIPKNQIYLSMLALTRLSAQRVGQVVSRTTSTPRKGE